MSDIVGGQRMLKIVSLALLVAMVLMAGVLRSSRSNIFTSFSVNVGGPSASLSVSSPSHLNHPNKGTCLL